MKKIIFCILIVLLFSCNRNPNTSTDPVQQQQEYEEAKMTIEEQEAMSPLKFLSADGSYRGALVGGNFLIEGDIFNNATVVTYKDVVMEIQYYSKTNSLIDTEQKTFYEFIEPGRSLHFRFKVWAPKHTETIGWDIVSAIAN